MLTEGVERKRKGRKGKIKGMKELTAGVERGREEKGDIKKRKGTD